MDSSHFKLVTTRRSFQYNYYHSPPEQGKPYLLLIHGFPSFATDWRYQVTFFKERGYGLIVPDMLGYGGTDKPTTPSSYVSSLICQDMVDILNAEDAHRVIAIGHDWGAKIASRLANFFDERFLGYGFLDVGYMPPMPGVTYSEKHAKFQQNFGREVIGYWTFFSDEGTPELIDKNFDSFISLLFVNDTQLWNTYLGPVDGYNVWLGTEQMAPYGEGMPEEEMDEYKRRLKKNGLSAPVCWYKVVTENLDAKDEEAIPLDRYTIQKPVFFVGAKHDTVALSAVGKAATEKFCPQAIMREFDVGHWMLWAAKDDVNKELHAWIETVNSAGSS